MSQEQRAELVAIFGEDIVSQSEEAQKGKGYGAIAIYCAEIDYTQREVN